MDAPFYYENFRKERFNLADLRILINGSLNEQETEKIISKQLEAIGKKLNVSIGVNNNELNSLAKKVGELQKQINKTNVSILGDKDTKKINQLEKDFNKVLNDSRKLGEVSFTKTFDPLTEQLTKFNLTIKKTDGTVEKLKYELAELAGIKGLDNLFYMKDKSLVDNTSTVNSLREKQLQNEQKINQQLDERRKKQEKELADLEHTIKLFQERSRIQATGLASRYGKNIDNPSLESYLKSVDEISSSTPNARKRMEELSLEYKNIATNARIASKDSIDFGDALNQAFTKFPIWMLVSTAFFAPLQALNQFVDTLYLLDDRLVSINKVMENANLEQVFQDATDAAYTYGQTIDATLESMGEIAKLGFGQEEATQLSNNAMLLSTVGEFKNSADAANYLVAIMRQYQMEVSETAKVVDSLNEVSNKTGADTVDLAQGLSKASSSADVAGVTFDELNGMLSSTVETLKISGNEAGTFYKTLFTRMQRSDTQKAIEEIGVATKTATGEMRPASEILNELGTAFDGLTSAQQSALAEDLGGVWHANKVISLLQQQDQVVKNTTFSMESYGSATRELQGFSEGLTFKTNVMKASFQELTQILGESGARDILVSLIELVTNMTQGFTEVTRATDGWNLKLPILIGLIYGGVKALGALRLALTGVKSSFGIFSLGIIAIEALSAAIAGTAKSTETFTDSQQKSMEALTTNKDQADELITSYKAMSEAREKAGDSWSLENEQEYLKIQQELGSVFPGLIESIDSQGRYHLVNKDSIEEEIKATEELIKSKKDLTILEAEDTVNDSQSEIKRIEDEIKALEDKRKTYEGIAETSPFKFQREDAAIQAEKTTQKILSLESDLAISSQKINDDIKSIADAFNEVDIDPNVERQISDIIESIDFSKFDGAKAKNVAEKIASYMQNIQDAIASGSQKSINEQVVSFNEYIDEISKGDKSVANLKINMDDLKDSQESNTSTTLEHADANDVLTDSIEGVNSAQEEKLSLSQQLIGTSEEELTSTRELIALYSALSAQENLSAEQKETLKSTYEQLAKIFPHLASGGRLHVESMEKEAEQTDILLQSIDLLAKGQLDAEEQMTLNAAIGVKNRITLIKNMINAYKDASEALYSMAKQRVDDPFLESQDGMTAYKFGMEARNMESDVLSDITNQLDQYMSSLSDATNYSGQYYKATDKNAYVSDKYKLRLEQINVQIAQLNSTKSRYAQHSRQYRNALEREIKLLKEQSSIYQQQQKDLKSQISSGNYTTSGSNASTTSTYKSSSGSYGGKYAAQINQAAQKYGVNPLLIAAIIQQESGFNASAVSSAGARGLMQLMPGTARELGVTNSFDPYQNIMGGTKYIAQQLKTFGNDIQKALAAYNAGAGNVRKYGGIPPFKETQNYVNKVLANFNKLSGSASTMVSSFTSASNSVADYYKSNFRVTGTFGEKDSLHPNGHKGLDLANGKQGDPVKSLRSGKVITAAYSKSAGYWVVVQQDDGTVAKYMHLQKGLDVKAGQTVSAGQKLGEVGNTGRSTGAHLHLQIEQNGKAIDPQKYMNGLSSTTSGLVSNLEAADNAQMELMQGQQAIAQINDQIQQLYGEIVNSRIAEYQRERDLLNDNIAIYERGMSIYIQGSKDWATMQEQREKMMGKQMVLYTEEIGYIKQQMKYNSNLSAEQKANLVDQLTAANEAYYRMRIEFQELQMEIINGTVALYQRERSLLEDNISAYERGLSIYAEGSAQWLKMNDDRQKAMGKQMVFYTKEIAYMKQQLSMNKSLSKQQRADLTDMITEANEAYYQLRMTFQSQQMDHIDAVINRYQREQDMLNDNLAILEHTASREEELSKEWIEDMDQRQKLLEQQKNSQWILLQYLENQLKTNKSLTAEQREQLQQKITEAAIQYNSLRSQYDSLSDEFLSAQESLADQVVELYKEAYEQQRDAALKAIDDEQEAFEKAHNEKLKMLREEREEDNYEKDLADRQEEIAKLQEQLNAYSMDDSISGQARADEIRKELEQAQEELQEFLTDREYSEREKALEEQAQQKQEAFDDERERLNKHYDNLLNDEARFQEIRQQVIIGNIQGLSNELMNFAHLARQNMEHIGESITNTFIDSISEVRNKLKEFSGEFQQRAIIRNSTSLFKGTNEGNLKYVRNMKEGEDFEITGYSEMNGGMYRLGHAESNLWVSASDVDLRFLKRFNTGGFTADSEGLAYLDKKEIVLNKDDTKNFLSAIKLLKPMVNFLKNPVLPKFNPSTPSTGTGNNITFSIENLHVAGGKQGFNDLMKEFNNRFSKSGVNIRL
ncbi:phage tail tape measure protein [Metabacillus sp. Hm71]|uniref:phage tail tape measure protein n=1 Tax=Metabacillus sp. Hm71 TaxID=3450743 RepID=UPI003F420224